MVEKATSAATVKKVRKPRSKNTNIQTKVEEEVVHIPKKRGRKPKGGKIVKKEINLDETSFDNQVVILHLKCKLNDLNDSLFGNINSQINYDPNIIKEVKAYSKEDDEQYYNLNSPKSEEAVYNVIDDVKSKTSQDDEDGVDKETTKEKQKNKKNIHTKLKELELLFNNNNVNKKSDCFWCTCDFTTHPIYIPSLYHKEKYEVYGCFCSPECAHLIYLKKTLTIIQNLKDINY